MRFGQHTRKHATPRLTPSHHPLQAHAGLPGSQYDIARHRDTEALSPAHVGGSTGALVRASRPRRAAPSGPPPFGRAATQGGARTPPAVRSPASTVASVVAAATRDSSSDEDGDEEGMHGGGSGRTSTSPSLRHHPAAHLSMVSSASLPRCAPQQNLTCVVWCVGEQPPPRLASHRTRMAVLPPGNSPVAGFGPDAHESPHHHRSQRTLFIHAQVRQRRRQRECSAHISRFVHCTAGLPNVTTSCRWCHVWHGYNPTT